LSDQGNRAFTSFASGSTLNDVAGELGVKHGTVRKYLEHVNAKYAAVGRLINTKLRMLQTRVRPKQWARSYSTEWWPNRLDHR